MKIISKSCCDYWPGCDIPACICRERLIRLRLFLFKVCELRKFCAAYYLIRGASVLSGLPREFESSSVCASVFHFFAKRSKHYHQNTLFLQRHSEKVMNFRFTCNFKIHLCKFVSPSSSPLQAPSNILKSAEMRSFAISKSNFMTFSYRRRAQTQQTLHVVEAPIPPHTLFSFSKNLLSFGFRKYSGYFSCPFEGLQVLTLIC